MRWWIIFLKTLREMTRDMWVLGLTLVFAPVFVVIYWIWFAGGSTTYSVIVINHDQGAQLAGGARLEAGKAAVGAIADTRYADGKPMLRVLSAANRAAAESDLRDRKAAAFIEIPADFSHHLAARLEGDDRAGVEVIYGGDLTNPYYSVATILALSAVDSAATAAGGATSLVTYTEKALGASAARSEFEIYVPGVIILSVILLIFQAAMSVAREIESGALKRLRLTPLTAFDLLAGVSLALALVAAVSVLLTFWTAAALGFRSQGPLWVAVLVGVLTSFSIIGIGLLVACFTRTVAQAFIVANFPMALLMFFSGAIFPMPPAPLFSLGGREVGLYDVLPPTHAVAALNKVLTLGAGLDEVAFELAALIVLSAVYFLAGVYAFQRLQMRSV